MNNKNDLIDIIAARTPEEPISQAELAQALGVRDTRAVRLAVQRLRRAGMPVISSCSPFHGGYWFTSDPEVMNQFLDGMKKRAHGIFKTARAMRRGVPAEQMALFEVEQ